MHFDFAALLVALTFISGIILLVDKLFFRKQREERLAPAASQVEEQKLDRKARKQAKKARRNNEPILVDYARSFFPVLVVIVLLRSFVYEPFRIPSSSMMPTLLIGDFILVNKFAYGLRLPVLNTKILDTGEPERGDVAVFRFPEDESQDYIKRIIGLPGDTIRYSEKRIFVNGEPVSMRGVGYYEGEGQGQQYSGSQVFAEQIGDAEHQLLIRSQPNPAENAEWVVPEGKYFAMGDNRDNSRDSRAWGFVPEENLVGRADVVWMNFDTAHDSVINFSRIGTVIE